MRIIVFSKQSVERRFVRKCLVSMPTNEAIKYGFVNKENEMELFLEDKSSIDKSIFSC